MSNKRKKERKKSREISQLRKEEIHRVDNCPQLSFIYPITWVENNDYGK